MWKHDPQLLESVLRSTSQPVAAVLSQFAKPVSQGPMWHVPTQKADVCGTGQQTEDAVSQNCPVPVGTQLTGQGPGEQVPGPWAIPP